MKVYFGRKGEMGIGTLIIFIAMILVAAVAAAVLVSTSGNLQQRSLLTSQQAEEGVATGADAVAVTGTNASSDHQVENFEVLLRLQAGSNSLNFDNTIAMIDTTDNSWSYDYSGHSDEWIVSSSTGTYAVEYMKQGPDYEDGYLNRGDVVKLKFNVTAPVGENKKMRVKVIPRVGVPTVIEFTTPDVMTEQRVSLWP
jgi:archaeal flagellin FlaB